MNTKTIQKIGGIAAILEGFIYITAFIIYGAVLVHPDANANTVQQLNFLSDNYTLLALLNFLSYVIFGILLAVLVLALHQRLQKRTPNLSKLAFIFGVIWVGLVIASGMIGNIGLTSVIETGATHPEKAMQIWSSVGIVTEGLGGGNEIVGGIWVLFISICGLKGKIFSKAVHILGILVGTAGILTAYPLAMFTEIFGLTQIIWFLWIGILMMYKSDSIR